MGIFFLITLKFAILLAAFWFLYRLLLIHGTLQKHTRLALLLLLPLILTLSLPFELQQSTRQQEEERNRYLSLFWDQHWAEMKALAADPDWTPSIADVTLSKDPVQPLPRWPRVILIIYLGGVVVMLLRHAVSYLSLFNTIRLCRRESTDAYPCLQGKKRIRLYVHNNEQIAPFSWFGRIVLSERDLAEHSDTILLHELHHAESLHSADVLVSGLLACFQWFNPFSWSYIRELEAVHEYSADQRVIEAGVEPSSYQLLILRKSVGERLFRMASGLRHSSIGSRLQMMLRPDTTRRGVRLALTAFYVVCFLLAGLTFMSFRGEHAYTFAQSVATTAEDAAIIDDLMPDTDLRYTDEELLALIKIAKKYGFHGDLMIDRDNLYKKVTPERLENELERESTREQEVKPRVHIQRDGAISFSFSFTSAERKDTIDYVNFVNGRRMTKDELLQMKGDRLWASTHQKHEGDTKLCVYRFGKSWYKPKRWNTFQMVHIVDGRLINLGAEFDWQSFLDHVTSVRVLLPSEAVLRYGRKARNGAYVYKLDKGYRRTFREEYQRGMVNHTNYTDEELMAIERLARDKYGLTNYWVDRSFPWNRMTIERYDSLFKQIAHSQSDMVRRR